MYIYLGVTNMQKKWLIAIGLIVVVLVVILYFFGFRITYAPELENSWEAISAVGTWAGVVSPLILALINAVFARDIEKTKSDIISSNRVIFEQKLSAAVENTPLNTELIKKTVIDYITVNVTASTEVIAVLLKRGVNEVYELLSSMENERLIVELNRRDTVEKAKRMWKVKQ